MSALAIAIWRKGNALLLAVWVFYLVTLLPVIGLVQVGWQAAADRYVYIPTMPVFLLLGLGFSKVFLATVAGRFQRLRQVGVLVLGVALFCSWTLKSRSQTQIWKSDTTLWQYTLLHNPGHWSVQGNMAFVYLRQGKLLEARRHYTESIALFPHEDSRYAILGDIQMQLGAFTEARELYLELAKRAPEEAFPAQRLGDINLALGQAQAALLQYDRSLQINPDNPDARLGQALVYFLQDNKQLGQSALEEILHDYPEFKPAKRALQQLLDEQSTNGLLE